MSILSVSKVASILFIGSAVVLMTACGGGGGGSSSSASSYDPGCDDADTYIDSTTDLVDTTTPDDSTTTVSSDGGDTSGCDADGCNSFSNGNLKDTDLQKAQAQQNALNERAQGLASRFDMSFDSAMQLSQLADQVKAMKVQGQLTSADRVAIAQSAFAIGGVSTDDVNNAVQSSMNGDNSQSEELINRAAAKMGMSSPATLRDKILPAIGVKM